LAGGLSSASAFWWGCIGGAVGWAIAFPLPIIRRMSLGRRAPRFTRNRILGFTLGLLAYIVLGGVASFILNPVASKEALVIGAGGVAMLGRLVNGDGANQLAKPAGEPG
jgi:hypothetical protein